ncbi:hypothetical protein RKLH11_1027 [Rhodobacteraceae bacterium KLH11]|nr:hypothetical protein RKLH11_1027 [Rhodobacteraceae bacterium KLH11]
MIRALILILITIGTDAYAQALPVRSGEHDGYTRLVIQVPTGTGWALDQRQGGAGLSIAINGVTFDTSAVFSRLSGTRLQSLSQSEPGAELDLVFGCKCVATAFLHRQTMVVVDIAPGELIPTENTKATIPDLPINTAVTKPLPGELPTSGLVLPLLQLSHRNFEDQLMSRILQSADREIVDLELADVGHRPSSDFGPLQATGELTPNLRVSSVLDNVQGHPNLAIPQFDTRPECITDSALAFETWASSEPFPEQVATLRNGLFQEFDRVDQSKALKLARLYAYYGFGIEATQMLALLPEPTPETIWLAAIAAALDNLPASTPNPFEGQQRCDGFTALWALLTEGSLHSDAQLNAIEQSFSQLPPHLRQQLGPELADILVTANQLEASRRILRAIERVLQINPPDVTLTKATIAEAAGETETAETLLTEVVAAPNAAKEAPLALARLVEKRWADRGTVTPRDLDLAASYARELRKSELGPMMARTHVLALALSQDFEEAIEHLDDVPEDGDWQRNRDQVLHLLAERADDITFLRYAIAPEGETRKIATVETAVAMAERLADLGFSASAYELANRSQDRGMSVKRAQLRARAALSEDRPRQALLEIAGDQSEAAQDLRTQAMIQMQDFEAAARLLEEIGEVEAADHYAWLAGTHDIDEESLNVFATLTRVQASLAEPVQRQPDKPLSDAEGLLKNSAKTRLQIVEMLNLVASDVQN